jgi:arylsulfatase A-like enzyme
MNSNNKKTLYGLLLVSLVLVGVLRLLRGGDQPDIILISIDSLRPDHLGCYGHDRDTSPTIDRMAREGVLFRNAVSTTSWTLPAHAAMLSGLYDSVHGAYDNGRRLCDETVLLPEMLKAAGYQTVGFFGGPYLHPAFGFAQGFDHYFNCMTPLSGDNTDAAIIADASQTDSASHDDITGPRTRDAFVKWLDEAGSKPIFAFIHLWDVHYDFIPPQKYVDMFDPGYDGPVTGRGFMSDTSIHAQMPKRDLDHLLARYDGEIRFTDDMIAEILAALERKGRLENAIVIITADHGEEFFEHGRKGHHRTLYDEVVKVPLVIRWAGKFKAGVQVNDQVRLVDIMPTVLAAARVPLTHPISGRDITPLLTGEGELPSEDALIELLIDRNDLRGVRSNARKLMGIPSRNAWEHYNLVTDPGEQSPAGAMTPAIIADIANLDAMLRQAARLKTTLGLPDCLVNLSAGMTNRLGGLGYLGSDEEQNEDHPEAPEPPTSPDNGPDALIENAPE